MNRQERKLKRVMKAGAEKFHKDFNYVVTRTKLEKKLSSPKKLNKGVWIKGLAGACVLMIALYFGYTQFFKFTEPVPIGDNSRMNTSSVLSSSLSSKSASEQHVEFGWREVDIVKARELFDIRIKEPENYEKIYVLYDSNDILMELMYQFKNGKIILRKGDYSDELIPQCIPQLVRDKMFYPSKIDPLNVYYFSPGFIFEAQFAGLTQKQIFDQIDEILF